MVEMKPITFRFKKEDTKIAERINQIHIATGKRQNAILRDLLIKSCEESTELAEVKQEIAEMKKLMKDLITSHETLISQIKQGGIVANPQQTLSNTANEVLAEENDEEAQQEMGNIAMSLFDSF